MFKSHILRLNIPLQIIYLEVVLDFYLFQKKQRRNCSI